MGRRQAGARQSFLHPTLCHLNAVFVLALVERREIVLQQPVDEDVAPADFAEEDALGGVVEETDIVPRDVPAATQYEAQGEVMDDVKATMSQKGQRDKKRQ